MKISGIYIIRNTITKQCYVGSSINIGKRWAAHKDQLRRKIHHSPYFQRSWHKYGEYAFTFHIMEELPPEKLLLEYNEQNYIDLFNPSFNVSKTAGKPNWTPEMKTAMSIKLTGRNNPNFGKKRPGHSLRMSGSNNFFYGKNHTERTKINSSLSKIKITKDQVAETIMLLKKGMTQKDIAKKFGVSSSVINRLTAGKLKAYQYIDLSGIDKNKISAIANSGANNWRSRLILDTQTGIYYYSIKEAAYAKNINAGTLSSYFIGKAKNKTSLISV